MSWLDLILPILEAKFSKLNCWVDYGLDTLLIQVQQFLNLFELIYSENSLSMPLCSFSSFSIRKSSFKLLYCLWNSGVLRDIRGFDYCKTDVFRVFR